MKLNEKHIKMDPDSMMEADECRNELNLMHAKIGEFLRQHPDTDKAEELTKIHRELSLAYNEAFLHCDKAHFIRWKRLLKNSKRALDMAGTNRTKLLYKGYTATMYCYHDDVEGGILFHGTVDMTDAMITFGGKTPEEAEQDFHDGIDDLLDEMNPVLDE